MIPARRIALATSNKDEARICKQWNGNPDARLQARPVRPAIAREESCLSRLARFIGLR